MKCNPEENKYIIDDVLILRHFKHNIFRPVIFIDI